MKSPDTYDRIYSVVLSIPAGTVATYGQVARAAGLPGRARQVGYAMRTLPPDSGVPWHRVVNAGGRISHRRDPDGEWLQRKLLEAEGIRFSGHDRLSLERYQWDEE
jgi:methylated-DNA-protein-cysteine methyltransferase-like protein